jgi:hypothetical protein
MDERAGCVAPIKFYCSLEHCNNSMGLPEYTHPLRRKLSGKLLGTTFSAVSSGSG